MQLPPRRGTYRLGVFGSMMDPPHLGHVAIVDAVLDACGLDRVVVVPSGIPPHREEPGRSSRARLTMAVRAFAGRDRVVVSDTEVERGEAGERGYMVDTLEELAELPAQLGYDDLRIELVLVVGADQAAALASWHRIDRIAELATIAVVRRPDQLVAFEEAIDDIMLSIDAPNLRLEVVEMPAVAISSTRVREVAATGDREALRGLVPGAIVDDVLRLYGPGAPARA